MIRYVFFAFSMFTAMLLGVPAQADDNVPACSDMVDDEFSLADDHPLTHILKNIDRG